MRVVDVAVLKMGTMLDVFLRVASHDGEIERPGTSADDRHIDQLPFHKESGKGSSFPKDNHHHHNIDPTLVIG